jgi:cell division transport system permease protein
VSRFKLILSEAVRSLQASVSTTFAATMTVLVCMFLLGFVIALGTWASSLGDHYKRELVAHVYFTPGATQKQLNTVAGRLQNDRRVESVKFITPAEGLKQMRKLYPAYRKARLPYNPLGAALTVRAKRGEDTEAVAKTLVPLPPGVDSVRWGKKTAHTLLRVTNYITIFVSIIVLLLLGAAALLIANTIRLSIFARRREIEVMKLVGASNWFVRGPFMVEGMSCALAGSIVAVVLLLLGKEIALPSVLGHVGGGKDVSAWPFEFIALVVLAVGLTMGAVGSGLSVRRFLRV